jgi:hypothetical protein
MGVAKATVATPIKPRQRLGNEESVPRSRLSAICQLGSLKIRTMKSIAAIMCVLLLLAPTAVFAKSDNGNGEGNGQSNGNGNGSAGGDANGNGRHDKVGDPETPPAGTPAVLNIPSGNTDQNTALDAVKSGAALPLDEIVPRARQRWGGRVIDAALMRIQGTLLYRLTMISDQGVSRRVFYDARSGNPVEVR